jgi:hypothetical protein
VTEQVEQQRVRRPVRIVFAAGFAAALNAELGPGRIRASGIASRTR